MHRFACVLLAALAGLGLPAGFTGAAQGPAEVPMVTYEGRPYVPLVHVAMALGAKVPRNTETPRLQLGVRDQLVVLTRGSSQILIEGKSVTLSSPVVVAGGRWWLPAEFLARVVPRVAPGSRIVAVLSDRAAVEPRPDGGAPRDRGRPSDQVGRVALEPPRKEAASGGSANGAIPAPGRPARLTDLRVQSYPTYTRVVLEADGPFGYTVERKNGVVRVGLSRLDVGDSKEQRIRDGAIRDVSLNRATGAPALTVSLDERGAELRPRTLDNPFRLVLDFARETGSPAGPPEVPEPLDHATGRARSRAIRSGEAAQGAVAPALRHIVLDAGHGGHDSGAVGPTGLMEKDVVLDVTRRVARLVREQLRVKVSLSRSDDTFVPLRDRTSFANREGADLFISIHANAHRDLGTQGVETYFLALEASDNTARQVAERENEVIKLEGPVPGENTDVLRAMLWDLSQNSFVEESSNLAETVQDTMSESLRIPNRGVKQAGFYVLGGAAMPAILVEIGFVTNAREERRLKESRYREAIARAIVAGISAYKTRYDQRMRADIEPPRVTR